MKMRTILAVLLLFAAVSAHANFDVVPPAPSDRSYVVVQVRHFWRDGCVPFDPQVTRTGNRIEVVWRLPDGGCPLIVVPWHTDVPLGLLPAGSYEVVLTVDDYNGPRTMATRTVVVSESVPAFTVEPRVITTAAPTEVTIDAPRCFQNLVVTVDGSAVPVRSSSTSCTSIDPIVATLPPHAPGAVTVRVQADGYDEDVVAAVRYVDPAALPDPGLYERVLVPVLLEAAGAMGSQWATEAGMLNASAVSVPFIPDVSRPLSALAPGASASLDVFGNRPSGLVLFVPRGSDVRFGSVIRDLSRDASQWGTEVPVVRESDTTRGSMTLLNVPFDPRYRLNLRLYGIDGHGAAVWVRVSREGEMHERWTILHGPCSEEQHEQQQWLPCNSNQPGYASVDLARELPALRGRYRVDIVPGQSFYTHRMWAFVSVTNNDTQHVTLITPQ